MGTMRRRRVIGLCAAVALVAVAAIDSPVASAKPPKPTPKVDKVRYDASTDAEYAALWTNPYGLLELDAGGTRTVTKKGTTVSAEPFHVGADFGVFDHLKYIGISAQSFPCLLYTSPSPRD